MAKPDNRTAGMPATESQSITLPDWFKRFFGIGAILSSRSTANESGPSAVWNTDALQPSIAVAALVPAVTACENSYLLETRSSWSSWKLAMKLVPVGKKVIVKRIEVETSSPGGIVLPETARPRPQQGRVLSVGDGRQLPDGSRVQVQVSEGDRVLFNAFAGTEVLVGGDKLLIMDEDEILAVFI